MPPNNTHPTVVSRVQQERHADEQISAQRAFGTAGKASSPRLSAAFMKYWRAAKVTRIHGKWYDLTKFSHPGGPVALSLGYGRDSTVLFESSHAFTQRSVLAALLAKYEATSEAQVYLNAIHPDVIAESKWDFDFKYAAAQLSEAANGADYAGASSAASAVQSSPISAKDKHASNVDHGVDDMVDDLNTTSSDNNSNDGIDGSSTEAGSMSRSGATSPSNVADDDAASNDAREGADGIRRHSLGSRTDGVASLRHRGGQALHVSSEPLKGAGSDPSALHGVVSGIQRQAVAASPAGQVETAPLPSGQDAFEADVKALFLSYFTAEASRRGVSLREATKAPPIRWAQLMVLTALFLGAGVVPLVRGWWPALIISPTIAWVWMVNNWHDAAHFAMSASWLVNAALTYAAPWFSSPLMWYHQHVIGHHAYTNVPGKDPDMYHAPKFWRFSEEQRWAPTHAFQSWTTLPLWAMSVPTLLLLKPLVALHAEVYNKAVPLMAVPVWRVLMHLVGRAFVFASLYVWPWYVFPGQFWKALIFSIVPIGVYSLWFMACSQVNHHTEETSGAWHSNWYRHQVMTSHNVAPGSEVAFWLSGGLNLQIEHHLFPCVNHWHLRSLQPHVAALAAKHGVHYTVSPTISEAFIKLWHHLDIMGRKPQPGQPGSKEYADANRASKSKMDKGRQ